MSPTWANIAEVRLAMRDWLAFARGRGLGDTMLRVSGVYIGLGGSAVAADKVRRALPSTGWMGFVEWANRIEDFEAYALAAAEHDLRVHSVVGDRLGEVLDVFERIDRVFPLAGRRWVVEHIGAMRAEDVPRLQRLAVFVSTIPFYSLWKNGKPRLASPDEGNGEVPQRLLVEAGLPLAVGSDNVPPSLFHAMWASVVRRERTSGRAIGPAQALTRAQALATMTRNGAWLSFEESEKGMLAPGMLADLAVLDGDPLTVADEVLPRLHALLTLVGGRVVHRTGRFGLPG
ncbi:MAG: amidohydrolase family protein [Pseudorhodoferax sp.]